MNRFGPGLPPLGIGLAADPLIEEQLRGEVKNLVWYHSPAETPGAVGLLPRKVSETEFLHGNKPSKQTSYLPTGMVSEQDTWIYKENGDIQIAMADGQGAELGVREIREIKPGLQELRTLGAKNELKETLTIRYDADGRVTQSDLLDVAQQTRVSMTATYQSRDGVEATTHCQGGSLDGLVIELRKDGEQTTVRLLNQSGPPIANITQNRSDYPHASKPQTWREFDMPVVAPPTVERVTDRDQRGNWTSKTIYLNGAVTAVWKRKISYY